jgi:cytoskeletal protein CcmA (bactofilin family)
MNPETEPAEQTEITSISCENRSHAALEDSRTTASFIGKKCEIVGTLTFDGPAVIDGKVEGKIAGKDRIMVGEEGFISTSKLNAASIVIAGTARVETIASNRIEILGTGKVHGDLVALSLIIHEGAEFQGRAFSRDPQNDGCDARPQAPSGQ